MKTVSTRATLTLVLAALSLLLTVFPQTAKAQTCSAKPIIDLSTTSPDVPADLSNPEAKFTERAKAVTLSNVCQPLIVSNNCGGTSYGEDFLGKLFARFAYKDLFGTDTLTLADGTTTNPQQEAIAALHNLQRDDFGAMGTSHNDDCFASLSFGDKLLDALEFLGTNLIRDGEGDVTMLGLVTVLSKYGSRLSAADYDHVLSLIDLSPGPGDVETLSWGADAAKVCPLICLATANPLTCLACVGVVNAESVETPESENHLNNIYVSQYLANNLLFARTGKVQYDNARNGYRTLMLNRLKNFVRNDFVEYNAHNYEDYTTFALLTLYSYSGGDPAVQAAAKMVLDYVSAKVAVSSNDARRSTPFRRKNDGDYLCDELLLQHCSDPHTAFFMMLAGVTDILARNTLQDWNLPNAYKSGSVDNTNPDLFNNQAPGSYSIEFQWASTTAFRVDPSVLDLFVDRSHRKFYQFFHYTNTGTNDELYFGSPSYLLSAGGHPNDYAYVADVPFPISLIAGSHPGQSDDLGVPVATTLMPSGDLHSREQFIRFSEPDQNMCVGPNFACGLNPVIPANYAIADGGPSPAPSPATGTWSFIDKSGPTGSYGYYVAVYRQDNFGFLEAYDTFTNPKNFAKLADFEQAVHTNNDGHAFSGTDVNTYKTVDGTVIEFTADAKIVTVNGNPPYDPNRTNGTIINSDGQGTVTISNPALGTTLTLDATVPPGHPQITVPGPLTFPDTCVGKASFADLNVCNGGNGSDDLFVYNILSNNTQFGVTEPSSGYPLTIGSNFCFPFQAKFAPTVAISTTAKIKIDSSDPDVPFLDVSVSGNGIQQAIATLIPNSGNFGNVCLGSFADINLTINNTGGCDLVINQIASSSPAFIVAGTLSFPLTVHAGDSLAVPVRFQPSAFGPASANITVSSNDPNAASKVVTVYGNAPPPVMNASIANTGAFGNVCAGTQSDLTLQVLNQGQCNLNISSINITGTGNFTLPSVTTYPLVVGANGSVNLPIRFQPPAYGSPNYITCSNTVAQTASVVIHSNDPVYPDPTPFVRTVNGIEGCPRLVLSPQNLTGAYAFPATVSDPNGTLGCYTDRQITASNSGICPLYMVNLTTANGVDGKGVSLAASPLEFSVANPAVPITIAPGAAPVPITVRFRPVNLTDQNAGAPDQQTGTLNIVSNDPTQADNLAALCGEPAYQSGARVLVVDSTGRALSSVASISLQSKGLTPPFSQTLRPAPLMSAPNVCGNTIRYHLDNELLRPAGTTGNSPNASYSLSAKNGSTQANMSFTLGACQVQQIVLQVK